MQLIKTFIVDDESDAVFMLQHLISECAPELSIVGTAGSVKEAHQKMQILKPELLFLDIQLKEKNGFDLLSMEFDFEFEVIFVTAYDNYALRAFQNDALSYLLKPVTCKALTHATQRAIKVLSAARPSQKPEPEYLQSLFENRIAVPNGASIEFISVNEIKYARADGSYCEIHFINGAVKTISKPLKYICDHIHTPTFFRAHRSYLVNVASIMQWNKADGGSIVLDDYSVIPLSKAGRKILSESMHLKAEKMIS